MAPRQGGGHGLEATLRDSRAAALLARAVVVVLALGPLLWAWLAGQPRGIAGAAVVLGAAGALAGVAGLSWLLLAMVLSIRVPGIDRPFGGLQRLWRIHHGLGAASFLLVMLHPVLLSLAAAPRGPDVVLAVLTPPWQAWPVWTGWLALLLMTLFLAPSFAFLGRPRYQRWKTLHRLSAGAVVLGVMHAVPLGGSPPGRQALWLWGGLGVLAGFAFLWRLLLSRVFSRKA
jgi:predicted ferric reductase